MKYIWYSPQKSKYPLCIHSTFDVTLFFLYQSTGLCFDGTTQKYLILIYTSTTIHRYPIFSTRYSVMCTVPTGYCGTSELEHGLCACTVDNPLAIARGLSLRTGAQTMLYLPLNLHCYRELNYLRMTYRFKKIALFHCMNFR